ncbi:MAG: CmcJ/NvfI family oxidoreductase [Hyphomicrobiales bacterium]
MLLPATRQLTARSNSGPPGKISGLELGLLFDKDIRPMAATYNTPDGDGFITAPLTYSINTGIKPVSDTSEPDGRLRIYHSEFKQHPVRIFNGRRRTEPLSLDVEGFLLATHPTEVNDFYDSAQIASVYYPEVEQLVQTTSGATRVIIFDHTLRHGDDAEQVKRGLRETVGTVHNDFTEWSGPQRLRDLVPATEAEALLRNRFAIIQVWRPIRHPINARPLALCDARSIDPADLIAAERRHPDRVGEIYQLAYNPAHRWSWFPRMQRDEALVFKVYDSAKDGRARFPAHASFDDPGTPADALPRESIEVRALALFATDNG